jgi:hypothetical protein
MPMLVSLKSNLARIENIGQCGSLFTMSKSPFVACDFLLLLNDCNEKKDKQTEKYKSNNSFCTCLLNLNYQKFNGPEVKKKVIVVSVKNNKLSLFDRWSTKIL